MSKPYSYHIFLFPFRWDFCKKSKDCKKDDFQDRTSLKSFHDLLKDNKNWKTDKYAPNTSLNYNEYTYFYDFVRDAIFDTKKEDKIMNHYAYDTNNKNYVFEISLIKGPKYKLNIKEIYLHVYTTGVALLSYHLENNEYEGFKDILKINEFGRRIYPQFLSDDKINTDITKNKFLADKISIYQYPVCENNDNNPLLIAEENFAKYNNYNNLKKNNYFILPDFIKILFGKNFIEKFDSKEIKIKPLIDDRMFVISWYGNNTIINNLKTKEIINEYHYNNKRLISRTFKGAEYNYLKNKDWYRYLFIDGEEDPTCQNSDMLHDFLQKHSYARFIDWGTLYGVSRYSFVCLTSDLETLQNYNTDFIPVHVKTMYYQMIVLSLMQRASILRFSEEVTEISKFKEKDEIKQLEKIKQINKAYLKFINTMYFREVTAQEQGIELYDMIQEHMRIEKDVKDLNREIDELYQFAKLLEDEKERDENKLHTGLATFFLPAMLISGILGMNIWDKNINIPDFLISWKPNYAFWVPVLVLYFFYFLYELFLKKHEKKWRKRSVWFYINLIIWFVALLYNIYYMIIK